MAGSSLDGKTWKHPTSKSTAAGQSGHRAGMPFLCGPNPEAGLKDASPPANNPWGLNRNAKQRRTGLRSQGSPPPSPGQEYPARMAEVTAQQNAKGEDGHGNRQEGSPSEPGSSVASQDPLAQDTTSRTSRSMSMASSSESRQVLQAAIPRAGENLWSHPVGADIRVHVGTATFMVHRDIVTSQSGWFRDNLPPPNENQSPVDVYLNCMAEPLAFCLRFMYTQRVEICDERRPFDPGHLPRCVLGYCSAVLLRVTSMVTHILRIVEHTATDLAEQLRTVDQYNETLIHDALDLIYSQRDQRLMKPMRLAMANLLNTVIFFILPQAHFRAQICSPDWNVWLPMILADQIEYRSMVGGWHAGERSIVPEDAEIEKLLEDEEPQSYYTVMI